MQRRTTFMVLLSVHTLIKDEATDGERVEKYVATHVWLLYLAGEHSLQYARGILL